MVFHGSLVYLGIKQNGTVFVDPGHTEAIRFYIFQKGIAVLFRTGDYQTEFVLQLLYLHTGKMVVKHTHHNTERTKQNDHRNQHSGTKDFTCHVLPPDDNRHFLQFQ